MRRTWMVVAAVAAAGLAVWLLRDTGSTNGDPAGGDPEARDSPSPTGPSLEGTQARGAAPLLDARGRCGIVGTVRRAGSPVAARVEVRILHRLHDRLASPEDRGYSWDLDASNYVGRVVAALSAGPGGRFRAEGLATGVYRVSATAEDGARGIATTWLEVDGHVGEANPSIAAGGVSLRGRVLAADGRPCRGFVVVFPGAEPADAEMRLGNWPPPVAVDAEGRFVATGLEPGSVRLDAIEGHVERVRIGPIRVPYDGEFVLHVDAGRTLLRGRVVAAADGAPVAAATVIAQSEGKDPLEIQARTQTRANGEFETALSSHRYLYAFAEGFALAEVSVEDDRKEVEIRLVKGASLSGRVTSRADGRPVAGMTVHAGAKGEYGMWRSLWWGRGRDVVTDGAGRYEAHDLDAKDLSVFALGAGFISEGIEAFAAEGRAPQLTQLKPGESSVVDLVVVPAPRAHGTVRDERGAGVAGARVEADAQRAGSRIWQSIEIETVASGDDGAFEIDALVPGQSYLFKALAAGRSPGEAGPLKASGAETLEVPIVLPVTRSLRVTVIDATSHAPISGARISVAAVHKAGGIWGFEATSATTDAGGRASLDALPQGALGAVIDAEGYVKSGEFDCIHIEGSAADTGDLDATLALAPETVIAGKAVLPDGSPARDIAVRAMRGTEHDTRYPWREQFPTAEDGSFRITGLVGGTYTVTAEARRQGVELRGRVTVNAGTSDAVLALAPAGTEGSVLVKVADEGGKPVSRAHVAVDLQSGTTFGRVNDGAATFEGALKPNGFVCVWAAESSAPYAHESGAIRRRFADGETSVIEVRLPTERTIAGRVIGPDGRGVAGVDLEAVAIREDRTYSSSEDEHGAARSAEGGQFRIGRLGQGAYRIEAKAAAQFVSGASVKATAGDSNVVLSLHDATAVTIRVVDVKGKPVAGAAVLAYVGNRLDVPRRDELNPGAGTTDPDGAVHLSGLAPEAAYKLEVEPPEDRLDLRVHAADGWAPHDDTVHMPRSWIVEGTVRDRDGRPVAGVGVSATKEGSSYDWEEATTAADGSFRLGHLATEEVTLMLTPSRSDRPDDGVARRVKAGGPAVSLELDIGQELVVRIENWPKGLRGREALLTPNAQGGTGRGYRQKVGEDGVVRFRGLHERDVCVLFIESMPDESCLYQPGLKAGLSEARVRLQPGKAVSGHVLVPESGRTPAIYLQGPGMFLSVTPAPDGRFEFRGVPDGEWELSSTAYAGDVVYDAEAQAKAGATSVELKFEKR